MTWKLESGIAQLTNLSHVGIAVKDAEKTAGMLSSIWNIGTPEAFEYWPKEDELIAGTEQAATGWRAPVTNILVTVYDEYLSKRDMAQADVTLCEVALAIRDYQAQHGQFPDKLKQLPAPPAGPQVTDPYSGQPLVYHRVRSGFILYSLGPTRRDEEGQPNEDEQGRVLDTGNIVWSCGEQ